MVWQKSSNVRKGELNNAFGMVWQKSANVRLFFIEPCHNLAKYVLTVFSPLLAAALLALVFFSPPRSSSSAMLTPALLAASCNRRPCVIAAPLAAVLLA
jgi:hypothetical protein